MRQYRFDCLIRRWGLTYTRGKQRTTVVFIESHPTTFVDSTTNLHGNCRAYAVFKLTLAVCTMTAPTLLCTIFVFRSSIVMHLLTPFLRPIRNDDGHMRHGTICRQRFVLFFYIYIHENWNKIDRNRHSRRALTWRCRWSGLSVRYDILCTCYGRSLQTVETKRNIKAAVRVCKRRGGVLV